MAYKVFSCAICDKPEAECKCDRYCTLCHSPFGVRLCEDGLFYCPDCREACDYRTQDPV